MIRALAAGGAALLVFAATVTAALAQTTAGPAPLGTPTPPPSPTPAPAPPPSAGVDTQPAVAPAVAISTGTSAPAPAAGAAPIAKPQFEDPRPMLVPVLNISGSEKGEGKISAGLDVLLRDPRLPFDLQVGLKLDVTSNDGLSTVLAGALGDDGIKSGGTWQGGADLTIVPTADQPTLDRDITGANRLKLLLACLRDDFDATVARIPKGDNAKAPPDMSTTDRVKQLADILDYQYYCDEGQKAYLAQLRGTLPVPRYQFSIGARVGAAVMTYLEPAEAPGTSKLVEDAHKRVWQVGGRAIWYTPSSRSTIEVSARVVQSQKAASDKARWCVDDGTVAGAPSQVCKEQPNRAPKETVASSFGVYKGYVASDRTWRASVGFAGSYTSQPGTNPWQLGVEMPLFLTRSTSEYSGLVRVTPSVMGGRNAKNEYETTVLLTVALLGKRTLFQTALE